MRKVIAFFSAFLLWMAATSFVSPTKDKINWLTVAELQAAYNKDPRPILVDVYTHWCGWCKVMDKDTYDNDNVADYINNHYYAVKFDAESKEPVDWVGKTYSFNDTYKVNEFSLFITNGQMSYPTTVLLADINGQPAPLSGYLKPSEIEPPLKYFGDGVYKTENYPDFIKNFSAKW
jgi:uncharacterized protein YyaL (SSP411 family)